MTAVHVVVPDGIDDPARPSGGNAYDRRICHGLAELGWPVHEHAVPGSWPRPDAAAHAALAGVVGRIPDGAVALIDGLVASTAPEVLVPQASRLRLVVLVHMPLGQGPVQEPRCARDSRVAVPGKDAGGAATGQVTVPPRTPPGAATRSRRVRWGSWTGPQGTGAVDVRTREGAVLSVAASVVTTSAWSRQMLLELYSLPGDRVHVAAPGVDAADLAPGTAAGRSLLCVAAVIPGKGHDVLLAALATMQDLLWECLCVGSLDRDPAFAESLRRRLLEDGLGDRVRFPGPRVGSDLDRSYMSADLVVLASRMDAYGMVVTEALARGLPVVAADVGGVGEALGRGADGTRPGRLVPPEDPPALAAAVRAWLGDPEVRLAWRRAARERRASLSRWSTTTSVLAGVLAEAAR